MTAEEATVIQSYLASFNKEIECDDIESENEQESEVEKSKKMYSSSEDEFLDENSGEIKIKSEDEDPGFYYEVPLLKPEQKENPGARRKAAEIIRLGVKKELKAVSQSDTVVPDGEEEFQLDDQQTLEMVAHLAEEAVNRDIISDLGAYQTVTVVPSDTNPGELSYVLFVSEDGNCLDADGNDVNLALYNLSGNESFDESFLAKPVKHTSRFATRQRSMGPQLHMCSYCNYSSNKRYLLSRHMKSHSDERPHKCGVCERGFKTLASLQNHVNTHTGTRPHPCKECDSCFTTSGELVRHVRYKHTHEKPHKCTECDYASVELSKLKRHMRCHTGERPYHCPHCTYASPDTYKLKRHLRIHTGEKPYECDICQARFTQSNSLKAHKLIHSGNKPVFRCEYCPATCGRKTDLRIHMEKLHSSDKPHRCNRCGKVFLDRYSYKIHIKSHEGEKCYKCDLCDYASISPRHLETHMFVHTDQKPFHCDECDQSFRQKQLLKRHKNLYHDPSYVRPEPKEKPHVCVLCNKAFRHRGNLIRHFALHDPEASVSEKEAARLGDMKTEDEEQEEEECLSDSKTQDEQVVVFEVIQLPSANKTSEEPVTMIDGNTFFLNNADGLSYSIIEPADDNVNNFLSFDSYISDSEDVENMAVLSPDNKHVENNKNRTNYASRKRVKSLPGHKSARKSTFKKPRILKAYPEKERMKVRSIPTLAQDEALLLQKDKEIEQHKELFVEKDFEECFGFNDKEEDLLTIPGTGYSTLSSTLVPDIS